MLAVAHEFKVPYRTVRRMSQAEFWDHVAFLHDKGEREREAIEKAKAEGDRARGGKMEQVYKVRGPGLKRR